MLVEKTMKCLICGKSQFTCIHHGTRDIPDINVMKCTNCGIVLLDNISYNTKEWYSGGGMLKDAYRAVTDNLEQIKWEEWIEDTKQDDDRRYEVLKERCIGKSILEFGCGNGGFLRRIKKVACDVSGVELLEEAEEKIGKEGIKIYRDLKQIHRKYDVICMFMVIEHLNNPNKELNEIYNLLNPNGLLICETPNAEDALISKYHCKAFQDFTYWSEHVVLYNSDTLEKVMLQNGFKTKENTQIQRYSLANHLYWLSNARPGGHMKWTEFNEQGLDSAYARKLIQLGIADTLWYEGIKVSDNI